MKNLKRTFWGISFIAIALVIIMHSIGLLSVTLSFGKIIIGLIAISIILGGISENEFGGIFLGFGILWLAFGKFLGLPEIGLWPMLIVVILLSAGFHILFPKKWENKKNDHWVAYEDENQVGEKQTFTESENNGYLNCSNKFGALAKYVKSPNFKGGTLSNQFGELKVYFDQAIIADDLIHITVNNSFGSLTLFVPRNWNLSVNVSVFAGDCDYTPTAPSLDGPTVTISGNVNFGELKIHLI